MLFKMPKKHNKIYVFNIDGKLIFEFESVSYASRVLCVTIGSIHRSIRSKRAFSNRFNFRVDNNYSYNEIKKRNDGNLGKYVYMFDSNFNPLNKFDSVNKASQYLKKTKRNIYYKINEAVKTHDGYYLSYNPNFKKQIKHNRILYVFDLTGLLINQFDGLAQASKNLEISSSTIWSSIKNNNCCMYKYFFSYNIYFKVPKNIVSGIKIREKKPYVYKTKKKKIYVFDKYGNFIQEFFFTKFTSDELKISKTSITTSIKNKTISSYKYFFSYEKDIEVISSKVPIYQFDLQGKLMFEFENINDAVNALKNTYTDTYNSIVTGKILRRKYYLRLEKDLKHPPN